MGQAVGPERLPMKNKQMNPDLNAASNAKHLESDSTDATQIRLADKFVESEVRGDSVDQAQDSIDAEIEEQIYQARRQLDDPSARIVRGK